METSTVSVFEALMKENAPYRGELAEFLRLGLRQFKMVGGRVGIIGVARTIDLLSVGEAEVQAILTQHPIVSACSGLTISFPCRIIVLYVV